MKLSKTYSAKDYEKNIYAKWLDSGAFQADPTANKKHFSMSMPPPNETGTLHIGHALFITLQDILARHHRSLGEDVLWLPGTDHAAIATATLIDKKLADQGLTKNDIGRAKYVKTAKEFVAGSRDIINSQLRAMGASADWSRSRYTLDATLSRIVNEVFVKMYKDGLIYRGHRIVNWDPKLQTNVSDDEVTYIEEKTKLYTFKFGPFKISTARPEVKFADKYVVVNPKDERYSQFKHLEQFEAEWINGRITATVIKDDAVDPSFGTGAMTITPWHSQIDFEISQKYNLDKEQVIDLDGKLMDVAGEFSGMSIDSARERIVQKLDQKGLLVDVDNDYLHKLALNSRGKGIIEPQIRLQWFVDVNKKTVMWKGQRLSFKEILQSVIKDGDIKIIPKHFEKVYFNWIDNLRDWCISRQIWWGHQIPVWYKKGSDQHDIYVGVREPGDPQNWQRDNDTLDTWFSASLWTFSTLVDQDFTKDYKMSLEDMLNKSLDFKTYHPTNVMETGWDILFFWVARMILSTTYATTEVPFREVYLHGLLRTETGKKMSKSDPESNIDPIDVIKHYGTDALRLALIQGLSAGRDTRLGISKVITNRNFCNKLWNVSRYIEDKDFDNNQDLQLNSDADHWILSKLTLTKRATIEDLNNYRFSSAYHKIYHFLRDDLADWYIEASKAEQNSSLLRYVLEQFLISCHPLAPFITETIWNSMGKQDLLAKEVYTNTLSYDPKKAHNFNVLAEVVGELRILRKSLNVESLGLWSSSDLINRNFEIIKKLVKVHKIKKNTQGLKTLTIAKETFLLDIDDELAKKYLIDLGNKKETIIKLVSTLKTRLNNKVYVAKAPEHLVEETKNKIQECNQELKIIESQKKVFESIN